MNQHPRCKVSRADLADELESVRRDRSDVLAELERLHGFLFRHNLLVTYFADRPERWPRTDKEKPR